MPEALHNHKGSDGVHERDQRFEHKHTLESYIPSSTPEAPNRKHFESPCSKMMVARIQVIPVICFKQGWGVVGDG